MKRCQGCFNELNEELEVCPYCGYAEGSYSENNMYLSHGTMLSGRYTIGNTISSDGISVTYAAWDNNSNIKVNIREFFPDGYVTRSSSAVIPLNEECKSYFESGFSNFVEEAKQLFGGNGNVRLYDCIAENNTAYMILESKETVPSPAAYAQPAPVSQTPAAKPKADSKGLPLWAKILIPSVAGVAVVGIGLTVLFTSGILNNKESEESEVTSEETTEVIETTKGITVDVEVMNYQEHSYACYGDAESWEAAKEYCEQLGGHLLVVNSAKENEAIWNYVNSKGYKSVYLGLSDVEEEGNWKWVNGDPVEYTNWKEGEPNAYTEAEDYAEYAFEVEGGYWNDCRYGTHAGVDEIHYVCEWDFEVIGSSNISYEELIAAHPTASPTPTPVIIDEEVLYSAYREVLIDYETEMREVENAEFGSVDSCALTDVTGDGFPELLVLYSSDEEYGFSAYTGMGFAIADIRIYTVFPEETTATEILHLSKAVGISAQGRYYSDVVLLSNGNILVEIEDGDEGWYTTYTEYEFDGYSFQQICQIQHNSEPDYGSDGLSYYQEYFIDGETMSEEDFKSQIENYKGAINYVLVMNTFYKYDEYTTEWEAAILDAPNNILSFDEAWSLITPSQSSESQESGMTYEQAIEAFESYFSYNQIDRDHGYQMISFEYSEDSDDNTCVCTMKYYAGAQTWTYVYYYMDLATGSVYSEEYWYVPEGTGVASEPGMFLEETTNDVFNGYDYI